MKWSSYLAIAGVAAALATAPVAGHAQDAAPQKQKSDSAHGHGMGMRTMGERIRRGPAEHILSHRTELGLSTDQVQRLEAIRDRYAASNEPHMEQLSQLRNERREQRSEETREDRRATRPRHDMPPEARAAMDSIRANHQAARQEAAAVLTEEQRSKLQEMMPRRGEERPRRTREMRRHRADSAQVRGA